MANAATHIHCSSTGFWNEIPDSTQMCLLNMLTYVSCNRAFSSLMTMTHFIISWMCDEYCLFEGS